MSPLLTLSDISKTFPSESGIVEALRTTNLTINKGEQIGIFGPSGAGKSTLLNILGLAETPTTGSFYIEEVSVEFENESQLVNLRRNFIGYIFQYFNLIPSMSALENVMLPLLLKGNSWNEAKEGASKILTTVGLKERISHKAHQLSGGEMQRVGIARAIVHSPKLILADEPTGNLDSKNGAAVLDLLKEVTALGASFVMVSHSQEALKICSRLISLTDGVVSE